jgi:hypothetical protein
MKKALLTTLALAVVTGALAQGTVIFNTAVSGSTSSRVYLPDADNVQRSGNTAGQLPVGTQTYTGALLTGSGWTAQLWAVPGNVIPTGVQFPYGRIDNSLLAATPTSTFRTGTAAGVVAQVTATLAGVPADAANAVLQMRVWPSSFGSWAAAVAAFGNGDPAALIGASPMFVVNAIGGQANPAPTLAGMVSFSVVAAPEPSSFALAGMGLASLLIFRRRK